MFLKNQTPLSPVKLEAVLNDWLVKVEQQINKIENRVLECPTKSEVSAMEEKIQKLTEQMASPNQTE